MTFAFRKINDSSFEVTAKLDGKPMYVDVYTVSADGKTLTDAGTPSTPNMSPTRWCSTASSSDGCWGRPLQGRPPARNLSWYLTGLRSERDQREHGSCLVPATARR